MHQSSFFLAIKNILPASPVAFFALGATVLSATACPPVENPDAGEPDAGEVDAGGEEPDSGIVIPDDPCVPPRVVEGEFTIAGSCDSEIETDVFVAEGAILTIEEGATLTFLNGTGILIEQGGNLIAEGGEGSIVLKANSGARGSWRGLYVEDAATAVIRGLVIDAAGGEPFGGLAVGAGIYVAEGAVVSIDDTQILTSGAFGIFIEQGADLIGFSQNSIQDSELNPIALSSNNTRLLDTDTDYLGEERANKIPTVLLFSSTVSDDAEWKKLNVPYQMTGATIIASEVTIEAGVTLLFDPDAGLEVIDGALIAVGEADAPIIFEAVSTNNIGELDPSAGLWSGLMFSDDDGDNELSFVEVRFGGGFPYPNTFETGNIYVRREATLEINNSIVAGSGGYGIFVENGGDLTESDNTFSDNLDGDVFIDPTELE